MSRQRPKNVAASVRSRLQTYARTRHEDFQLVFTRFAMERLLFRLSQSPHRDVLVLKGAMLFLLWMGETHRPTKDIDFLGSGEPSQTRFTSIFRDVFSQTVQDDGLIFDPDTVRVTPIREEAEYGGLRVNGCVTLERAKMSLQIDVGFGDAITPTVREVPFPTLLEFPAPVLRVYPRETVVAEKFEAMVSLGMANSRLKDFCDLWMLSQTFDFDGVILAAAIRNTFVNRKTKVEAQPTALTPTFGSDHFKQTQWQAFLKKTKLTGVPVQLQDVIDALRDFLIPVATAVESGNAFCASWIAKETWKKI